MNAMAILPPLLGLMLLWLSPARAQEIPPPDDPDELTAISQLMEFTTPTRITGRLLAFDTYDDAMWIEWTEVFSGDRWMVIPFEMRFIVYPREPGMMEYFRRLTPGTVLRFTIQTDDNGKRRVLEMEGTT
jgi:hypothetical protein